MKNLLLGVSSLLVFYLLIEGISRVYEQMNPDLFVELRGEPEYPEKEAGELRIFFHGGSTVAAGHLRAAALVPQAEYLVRKRLPERNIRFINTAKGAAPSAFALRRMAQTIDDGADAVVVLSAHNEFLHEVSDEELSLAFAVQDNLSHFALIRVARRFVTKGLLQREKEYVTAENRHWTDRNTSQLRAKLQTYRRNIDAMVELARSRNVPLILCTGPANVLDWGPGRRRAAESGPPGAALDRQFGGIRQLIASKDYERALNRVRESLERHPEDATLYFLRGRIRAALGEFEPARADLMQAKDLDPYPWRVLSEFNDYVRGMAGRPGVYVADVERVFEAHAEHGLIGYDLVSDNSHPTLQGYFLMAMEVVRKLADAGVVDSDQAFLNDIEFEDFWEQLEGPEGRRRLEISYLRNNGRYAMKGPFFHYGAARMYLKRAIALAPEDWPSWAMLGTISLLEGKVQQGKSELRMALALNPELEVSDSPIPFLGVALSRSNLELEQLRSGASALPAGSGALSDPAAGPPSN